jgi:hypothetical protein
MRYKADPLSMFKVMNKIEPFTGDEQAQINTPVRIAFEMMRTGNGVEDHFQTLAGSINVTMVLAEKIDPLCEKTAIAARDALVRCIERHKKTGKWGFDGPALTEILDAIDLHEQLIANQTPLQIQVAMKEVIRRMDNGDAVTGAAEESAYYAELDKGFAKDRI